MKNLYELKTKIVRMTPDVVEIELKKMKGRKR